MKQKKDEYIYKIIRYGKWLHMFLFAFSCSTIIFQILRDLCQDDYVVSYSYERLILVCIIVCALFLLFYFLEKYYAHKINGQKIEQLLSYIRNDKHDKSLGMLDNEENMDLQDEKNISIAEEKVDWKIIGLETCIRVAKENLRAFCDGIYEYTDACDEGVELLLFEKLTDRLLQARKDSSFSLSGIDIRLIVNQLQDILLAYKQHRYDNYIEQLDMEEQLRIQLLLCDESFELICETMKERFHYIPSQFAFDLEYTISCLEKEIEKENVYAQYDFANICLSSDDYQAMDLAIALLYKAQDKHAGAKEYIQRLRDA